LIRMCLQGELFTACDLSKILQFAMQSEPAFSRFAFTHDEGDIGMVFTQFGIHIIQILDKEGANKGLKLISIAREITPSDATFDRIYNEASQFASEVNGIEEFSTIAEQKGYTPRPVTKLAPFDETIPGLGLNREIVQWAHKEDTEVGDIQLFNNNNESSVVVIVTNAKKDGYASLEDVKEEIKPEVIRKKKAEQLAEKLKQAAEGKSDLNAIASALGKTVKSHTTTYNNLVLPSLGREPKVVGRVSAMEPNVISKPVEGNRGVYLLQVTTKGATNELPDYSQEQQKLANAVKSTVNTVLFNTLKDQAKVDDRRAKFY